MKAVLVVSFALLASNSFAAWTGIKCSNSDGTVNWQSGYKNDQVNLKYANFVEGTLILNVEEVTIQSNKEITLKEKTFRGCGFVNKGRVYATDVKITASDKNPDVLRSQFPENKIQTTVICTSIVNNSVPCEVEDAL